VLRCASRADGSRAPEAGLLLERYDDQALGGRGWVRWTGRTADAFVFASAAAAHHARVTSPPLRWFVAEIEAAP
jgi:hypothetical protein